MGVQVKEITQAELEIARYFAQSLLSGLDLSDGYLAEIRKIPGNGIEFSLSRKAHFFSPDFGLLMTKIASMINDARQEQESKD